jgi:glc operon protein GlcG
MHRQFAIVSIIALLGVSSLASAADAPATAPAAAPAPAQAPAAYPLDDIPDAMPFATPYGAPIPLIKAQWLIDAARAEATRRNWAMSVAVVDSGGTLVGFARMDGANLASAQIAGEKAKTAVKFRRPSKWFEDAIQKKDYKYQLSLPDVLASRGGLPLIEDGKVIGAIGCSGGTGSQDEAVCLTAAGGMSK